MKKKLVYIVALALLTLGFTACEKDSAGKTRVTYYAEIILEGESTMVVSKGATFVDPGFTATMAGEDVTNQVKVESNVNTAASGVYTITYSMVNADGFTASTSRTVIVLDLADPIEGFWAVTPTSYRLNANTGAEVAYGAPFEILMIGQGGGNYLVDDMLAGWYCQRAGYGENYAMQGLISIADGAITLLGSAVPGWGDSADKLENGVYNAAANTITYELTYAGYLVFYVTLNKVEL